MPLNRKKTAVVCSAVLTAASSATVFAAQKAEVKERVSASQPVGFDVYLPLQHRAELEALLHSQQTAGSAEFQKWLTPAQFHERFGADAASIAAAQQELARMGLTVTPGAPQHLHVTGAASTVELALGTHLHTGVFPNGKTDVVATEAVTLPSTLSKMGAVVTGFSGTVRMHTHSQKVENRYSTAGPYWFTDLKQAYSWPGYQTGLTGKGVNIGILISGSYLQSDLDLYFGHEKLGSPKVTQVNVNGGSKFDPTSDGSFEAGLDLQQSGGMAPNANITVYSIPDLSDNNIIAGLLQIVEDNKADVVSMSFGGPEIGYQAAYTGTVDQTYLLKLEDDIMAQGNAQGITFIASSGDSGALSVPAPECFTNTSPTAPCGTFQASVEFPASSPHVTGVGGTNLATTYTKGSLDSKYLYEQAYADPLAVDIFYGTNATGGYWGSGGGDSVVFPQPKYQSYIKTPNKKVRTVPDLALHMGGCPGGTIYCNPDDSADLEYFGGKLYGVIGTSASAPDFAGLTALNIQRFGGRLGNENYYIYLLAAAQNAGLPYTVFQHDIPGYNGLYSTAENLKYNRVVGNGTVRGKDFLGAPKVPSAGTPQTPSNP